MTGTKENTCYDTFANHSSNYEIDICIFSGSSFVYKSDLTSSMGSKYIKWLNPLFIQLTLNNVVYKSSTMTWKDLFILSFLLGDYNVII